MPKSSEKNPQGKYLSTVRVGAKGQVVIPKQARDMFGIEPGDMLLLLADVNQGIAIVRYDGYKLFADQILKAQEAPVEAEEETE